MPLLLVLELQVQELAQAAALVQVREPEPVRAQQLKLAVEPLELVRKREPEPLALAQELAQRPELAAILVQARKLRVSRQLELQQQRLPSAAQERPLYLPALPMKAPCWGAPAW